MGIRSHKTDSERIRALLGVSRAEFSRRYHIPVRTLEDWDAGKKTPPQYVVELLERAVREDMGKSDEVVALSSLIEGQMATISLNGMGYIRKVKFNRRDGLYVTIHGKNYYEYEMK